MKKEIDFYFDIFSPYAYLANHRLSDIAHKYQWTINYKPVDLYRLKRAAGNTGPANREIPPKIKYLTTDLNRWAEKYSIPFDMIGGMETDRINKGTFFAQSKEQAGAYVTAAYHLTWGGGKDPNSNQLLQEIAEHMKWDVDVFIPFLDSDTASDSFEEVIDEAINRGVFGVPVMMIEDQMWWGNDRLDFLEAYISSIT